MKTILGRPAKNLSAKSTYPKLARKVAEALTARMVQDYEDSVRRNLEHYDKPPNASDFWVWLEGYADQVRGYK